MLKRFGIDPADACEWILERDNRQQHDADREREAGGHDRLRARVPRAEQEAEPDRDRASDDQHAPHNGRHAGPRAEQPAAP